jgi:transposase
MARTGRPKAPLHVSDKDRETLERYLRRSKTNRALALRAEIVLLCATGRNNKQVARKAGATVATVGKWRKRFIARGPDALLDLPRSGAPRKIGDERIERLLVDTLESLPKGATHWSTRGMAAKAGISRQSVSRIWRTFGLKPHRSETFQLSTDPQFVEKVRDVVGLYMNPPANALVLAVDEKSQIQALDRTQPLLPMRPDQVERRTPEYERHGTTSLFAALDVATGNVIGQCYRRHRSREFLDFLKVIDARTPADLQAHLVLDNYATHKTPAVLRWLVRHPRFHLHFIPTHSSWLNLVECWFAILTARAIKRGAHRSVAELEAAIRAFVDENNRKPRAFRWTKSADEILERVAQTAKRTKEIHGNR